MDNDINEDLLNDILSMSDEELEKINSELLEIIDKNKESSDNSD